MNKDLIIPATIFFFIFVGILSFFAVDGNIICVSILSVLGGAFLFSSYGPFPGFSILLIVSR